MLSFSLTAQLVVESYLLALITFLPLVAVEFKLDEYGFHGFTKNSSTNSPCVLRPKDWMTLRCLVAILPHRSEVIDSGKVLQPLACYSSTLDKKEKKK